MSQAGKLSGFRSYQQTSVTLAKTNLMPAFAMVLVAGILAVVVLVAMVPGNGFELELELAAVVELGLYPGPASLLYYAEH